MLRTLALLAAIVGLSTSSVAQTALPAVLLQAVSATEAAKAPFAFDFELTSSEQNWRARFDPNASPRLRLVAPSRDSLENSERGAFDRMAAQMEGVSWCAGEGMGRVSNVRLIRDEEATAVYAFQPTRESIRGEQARRFADRMRGEFTLIKGSPDISRLRLYVPQAFSPMPLVNLEHFNIDIVCAEAPNGRHYAAETTVDVRGAAFGQRFDEHTVQRARNLSAP